MPFIYAMSDIRGCYQEYEALLDLIDFSDEDKLYVLGDAIDRGIDELRIESVAYIRDADYY